jgi:RNAse (barnase) inhibitor barstar
MKSNAQTWVVDFKAARGKAGMLKAVAKALEFPPHFGGNLDALYDCLLDLPLKKGAVAQVTLVGLAHGGDGDAIHAAFADAREHFAEHGVTFKVIRE